METKISYVDYVICQKYLYELRRRKILLSIKNEIVKIDHFCLVSYDYIYRVRISILFCTPGSFFVVGCRLKP